MESAFGLVTKIPVSRIGEGEITVSVETKNEKNVKVFPVSQAAPFPHIEDLDRAVLCLDGIQIKDRSQVPPDNDQTREHPQI